MVGRQIIFRAIFVIWLAGVIWGSLINGTEMTSLENVLPLLASKAIRHFTAYTGLAIFSMLAFERWRGIAVALSMILLGILIEVAQYLSPGRTPALADAVLNAFGVISGIASVFLLRQMLYRLSSKTTVGERDIWG